MWTSALKDLNIWLCYTKTKWFWNIKKSFLSHSHCWIVKVCGEEVMKCHMYLNQFIPFFLIIISRLFNKISCESKLLFLWKINWIFKKDNKVEKKLLITEVWTGKLLIFGKRISKVQDSALQSLHKFSHSLSTWK